MPTNAQAALQAAATVYSGGRGHTTPAAVKLLAEDRKPEMPKTITIQPANTETGAYDVMKPRPYPFHIEAETGNVGRQDFWKGDPLRLMGFQVDADVQRVDVLYREFQADPETAVGKFAVFMRADGSMYSMTLPIESVTVTE